MGTENSLLNRYLDVLENSTRNSKPINEALGVEHNVVRFLIPCKIDFSLSQLDIQKVYSLDEYTDDISNGMSYVSIKRKLIERIEEAARDQLSELNNNSDGFHITPTEMPSVERARWFRTSPAQMLAYYKHQMQSNKQQDAEEASSIIDNMVGPNTTVMNP